MAKKHSPSPATPAPRAHRILPFLILLLVAAVAAAAIIFVLRHGRSETQSEQPASEYRGYYDSTQTVNGGEALNEVSIYDVDVEKQGDDLVISMQFSYDSQSTEGNTVLTGLVPSYTIRVLPQPYRLALTLENVTDWTFTGKTSWLDEPLLQGVFVAPPTYSSADNPTVVFHLADNIAYRVREEGGTLKIYCKAIEAEQNAQYYVLINGISEYSGSADVRALDFTPTLCSDSVHTLLISRSFATQTDAEDYLASVSDKVRELLPDRIAFVQKVDAGALPEFPDDLESSELNAMPVALRDGAQEAESGTPVAVNASALCASPDGSALLCYAPVYTIDPSSGETVYSERVFFSDENGTETPFLDDTMFSSILYAQFSADGNRIGILDYNSDDNSAELVLYDRSTQKQLPISYGAFGEFLYDFVFDESAEAIYAVTLEEDGGICVRRYSIASGASEVLFALHSSDGMLAVSGNVLYFADTDENGGDPTLYRYDLQTGARTAVADATRFVLSQDGALLAAACGDGLRMIDTNTLQTAALLPDVSVTDFHFAPASHEFLCIVERETPEYERYPAECWRYTDLGAFEKLFYTDCIDVLFSRGGAAALLNDAYYTQDGYIPVVYRIDF